ncbi:MAG TPA: hypothetical protein VE915_08400 [Actinomycetota bacterium]|nr:hypothetical protein [Actinomycetota bacterium]
MTYEDFEDTELAAVLSSLHEDVEEPPLGFAERLREGIRRDLWWRTHVRRLAHDRRTQYAAASLGGALVGAATIAVLVWRRARRPEAEQTIAA